MKKRDAWLDEMVAVFKDLGGSGTWNEIYEQLIKRNVIDFAKIPHWKSEARRTVYFYSSECDLFMNQSDLFYSIYGKGQGCWGLVDHKDPNIVDLEMASFPEGKKLYKQHVTYERNPKVVSLAKIEMKKKKGKVFCEVCNFDFEQKYGEIGKDYIEGHHIIPVSKIPRNYNTKVNDIVLLCSNCHKMIHRRRPWITKEDLSELIVKIGNF